MRPIRTNPAYANLAYKKAILDHCVTLLQTEFTRAYGDDEPNQFVLSEDVFREDSQVPEEEIIEFISELQERSESIKLQMRKFTFVKEHGQKQPQQNAASDREDRRGKRSVPNRPD